MPQAVKQDKTGQKLPQFRSNALISAGSNLAAGQRDVASTVTNALLAVENRCGVIRARSPLYSTPAFPPGSGPDFVNAAFSLETMTLIERGHMGSAALYVALSVGLSVGGLALGLVAARSVFA